MVEKIILNLLHVRLFSFSFHKFPPSTKQIGKRNDIFIFMRQLALSPISRQHFLPVVDHALAVYKLWYQHIDHLSKKARYSLGDKIGSLLIEILELLFIASYKNREEKSSTLETATRKIDLLKFFLQITWEVQALDDKKYIALSEQIQELGKMVGGWKKSLLPKTPM